MEKINKKTLVIFLIGLFMIFSGCSEATSTIKGLHYLYSDDAESILELVENPS